MSTLEHPRVTNNYKKPVRKPTKPGNLTMGFWGACFPFTLAALATCVIDSFDIITDWLAYQTLRHMNISSYVPRNTSESIETFYANLPSALFALCIVSAVVFALHVAWYSYMFCRRRRMFLEKRDGVPYNMSFLEEYGGEILTLMQCLVQDLPMSLLYLLLQVSICCDLLFTLPNLIYLISFIATTFSASFKVIQVVWRSGCFGQRYEYNKKRPLQALRIVTLIFVTASLVTSSLNLMLLASRKLPRSFLKNDVFDNVGIKSWISDDKIILYHNSKLHQENENSTSVVALRDVIDHESEIVTVIPPCCLRDSYFAEEPDLVNCSLVYQFQYSASDLTIFYNYGYKCHDTTGSCVSRFWSSGNHENSSEQTDSPPLHLGSVNLQPADGDNEKVEGDPGNRVGISDRYDHHWIKCSNIQLVLNRTLLEFNPCSFSPLEQ